MKLAVLTSGGDAPGMNAAIRAVVRRSIYDGIEIFGVSHGFHGLIQGRLQAMQRGSVADIIHRGGTILRSARSQEFLTDEGQERALAQLSRYQVQGLVVIGGDGSLRGALSLARLGLPVAVVPATIDNDMFGTDSCIGFDTAINTVIQAVDRLRDTATSHERVFVVETMGRDAGFLALTAGLAGGAETILVPEVPWDLEVICQRLLRGLERGKVHSIIVVAEGAASGAEIARRVIEATGLDTRLTVLGHTQRGGTPTAHDRVLGSRLGQRAVELMLEKKTAHMVGMQAGMDTAVRLSDVIDKRPRLDGRLYELAQVLAI